MATEIEKNFARVFNSSDGHAVLAHLRKITIERVLGPNASDAELRGIEAQRALVHQIEQLSERGK